MLARGAGDDRRSAGAGAAAHAGGDEHHVRARELVADLVDHLLGRRAADFGLRAGAEALGHLQAHLDDAFGASTRSAPARRCWRRRNRRPSRPDSIMLLTALPPAPPTPKTVMCGFNSRMSGACRLIAMTVLPSRGLVVVTPAGADWMVDSDPRPPRRRRSSETLPHPAADPREVAAPFPCPGRARRTRARNIRAARPADRRGGRRRPRRTGPWPLRAGPRCRAAARRGPACRMRRAISGRPMSWLAPPVSTTRRRRLGRKARG